MTRSDEQAGGTAETPDRVAAIEADLRDRFPDADLTVARYADHLDVRVVPTGLPADLERAHDGATVTPYNALKFTVQLDG